MRLLFLICFITSFFSFSKDFVISKNGIKIKLKSQKITNVQRKFFGADLWFVGKKIGKLRNVMSVLYNSKSAQINKKIEKNDIQFYKKEMRAFANIKGYENVKFEKTSKVKVHQNLSFYQLGWSYRKNNITFKETSFYTQCSNVFFIAKATTIGESTLDNKSFKEIIRSASCE